MGLASKGRLEPGADADIVVIDPTDERLIKTRNLHQKADCTPYEGMVVRGWPRHVWLRGEPIIFGRQPLPGMQDREGSFRGCSRAIPK